MKKQMLLLMIFILGLSPFLWGGGMSQKELDAQNLYIDAVSTKGSMKKIEKAEKAYQELILADASKINYQFRIASLTAAKAQYKFWPNEKLSFVNDGVRKFDRVERKLKTIDDTALLYEFHLYRGRTYIHFPGFLGKKEIALSDFKLVANMAKTLDRPKEELGPFYLAYAIALKNEDQIELMQKYAQMAMNNKLTHEEQKEAKKLLRDR